MTAYLRALRDLTKAGIAVVSTLTAATGWIVHARALGWGLLGACAGTVLLAMGAGALNEWQERHIDARMARTRTRPIPSGAISPRAALFIASSLIAGGAALLGALFGPVPTALGLLAVVWYNGVYTSLKRVSAFAVVPGSLIGAIPPAIGWTASGGGPFDGPVLALAFFFFIWQVPHFWLLLFRFGKDYAQAGFPTLTQVLAPAQLARLTFVWMVTTAASGLLLPIFGVNASPWVSLGLALAGLWLGRSAWRVFRSGGEGTAFRGAFVGINVYACAVMALLAVDLAL